MNGGFGLTAGAESEPFVTAWVSIALAAADINPQIQRKPGGKSAFAYLLEHADELSLTTDFERELLVVDAAGASPHDFAGVDLVAKILERALPEPAEGGVAFPHEAGSKRAGMNDTIFAVIALSPIHEPAVEAVVQQAASWIEHEQNANGSWPDVCPKTVAGCHPLGKEPPGESDMTGAAIEALNAAGRHHTAAQAKALAFLHTMQVPSEGGFIEQAPEPGQPPETEANVASTAWVVQGLWAAEENPENWSPGGIDPLTYIESMQQPDGHMRWRRTSDLNGVWMTAYCGPALFGDPIPVTETPPPEPPPTSPPPFSGNGGEGAQSGNGVDAGGGGEGAPLFSRPQLASQGRTPGGARVLASKASRKQRDPHRAGKNAARRRRNPGPPRRHRAPTLAREAARAASKPPPTSSAQGGGPGAPGNADRAGTGSAAANGRLSVPAPATPAGRRLQEVAGIPIGSPDLGALEAGAPGLHGAGQKPASAALAIAIAAVAMMLAFAGARLEQRRPRTIR